MHAVDAGRRSEHFEKAGFDIERRSEGATTRLILHGELDLSGQDALRDALLREERSGAALVVVLDQLAYLDSAGIGQLVDGSRRARQEGRRFSVTSGTGNVQRLLWISGVLGELCDGPLTGAAAW